MLTWDVAVIGGGIAGSTAAALLAQGGLRVILLEKGSWPRQKVCGEFLSPEGADILRRLGVWRRVEAHSPKRIHTFALSARGHETRRHLLLPGWGVSRWVLDHQLWEHAQSLGVAAWARSPVVQLAGDYERSFSLTLQRPDHPFQRVQSRAVVCAAGRHWRPHVGQRTTHPSRRPPFVGLKAHVRGVQLDGRVELHAVQHGYCGLVEVDGGAANLCCWAQSDALRLAGGTPQHFLTAALRQNARLRARLQAAEPLDSPWSAVSYTYRRLPTPVRDGIWHVGDSAAMVAPLTGDGMGMGLRSAELAATILQAAFRQELTWEQAAAEYDRRWRQAFLPRLRWGRRLEALLLRPRLAGLACLALNLAPWLVDAIYRRTRDITPVVGDVGEAGLP